MRAARGSASAANGGEGSSNWDAPAGDGSRISRTLDEVMRAPSTNAPDVVVLDRLPEGIVQKEVLDPKEDLWLSTADGRFNSPTIPLQVGELPYAETFYVHKDVLLRSEYFRKALCGGFKETEQQSIDLPEDDPAIFHFLIAFLYEGRYIPIRPAATVLVPDQEKGKGREGDEPMDSDSDSTASILSDSSARSRRRRDRRRRREDRHFERMRQKHPGLHRPNCNCPQCLSAGGPPCWHCAAPRVPPPAGPMPPPHALFAGDRERSRRRNPRRNGGFVPPPAAPMPPVDPATAGDRIRGEDLATWLLAYELNLDVYILADKYLMEDFKREVARVCIDQLETAGADAAQPPVLRLCRKLFEGLNENDALLKMIFARIGFLQPVLWRRAPKETSDFLVANPEVGARILKETASRREEEFNGRALPSLERPFFPVVIDSPYMPRMHPQPRPPRW